jgi:hypothetical protein
VQLKKGKVYGVVDLPSIFINFYPTIIKDINFLLHNASDSYYFCKVWYQDQNDVLIKKWDEEILNNQPTPSLKKNASKGNDSAEKK